MRSHARSRASSALVRSTCPRGRRARRRHRLRITGAARWNRLSLVLDAADGGSGRRPSRSAPALGGGSSASCPVSSDSAASGRARRAPGLLLCQEVGLSPGAPGRRPEQDARSRVLGAHSCCEIQALRSACHSVDGSLDGSSENGWRRAISGLSSTRDEIEDGAPRSSAAPFSRGPVLRLAAP
jgi:hypothetical protein